MDDFLGKTVPSAVADETRQVENSDSRDPRPSRIFNFINAGSARGSREALVKRYGLPRPSRLACLASPGWGGPVFNVPRRPCGARRPTFRCRKQPRDPT
jgi:hypothetical protein